MIPCQNEINFTRSWLTWLNQYLETNEATINLVANKIPLSCVIWSMTGNRRIQA